MPKMKSRRGAAKRFSFTGSGKVRKNKANKSHLLSRKSMDRKRSLRKSGNVSDADAKRVKKMLWKEACCITTGIAAGGAVNSEDSGSQELMPLPD